MSVDKFGLGDWWPRPQQAAAGALDHLPADQWPMLAAKWLAAGFDSPSLRQLAQLQTGESPARPSADRHSSSRRGRGWAQPVGRGQPLPIEAQRLQRRHREALEAQELMHEVLRSIGFDAAPANKEFIARCQAAVDIVQRDLDATGYGQYQMRHASAGDGLRRCMRPCRTARTGAEARACPERWKVPGFSSVRPTRSLPHSRRYRRSRGRSALSMVAIRVISGTVRTPLT